MNNCYKTINIDNLKHNLTYLKNKLLANTKICAVVKSNGYGHDTKTICSAICDQVDYFAVSNNADAIFIKSFCKSTPCLVLTPLSEEKLKPAIINNVVFCLQSFEEAKKLSTNAKSLNTTALFHLKINTGMNRYGIDIKDLKSFFTQLKSLTNIQVCGIFSHLGDKKQRSLSQQKLFDEAIKLAPKNIITHLCNTQNLEINKYDMVRIGIGLYGYGDKNLKPVMNIYAKILAIQTIQKGEYIGYGLNNIATKTTRIAVVGIGYANGLQRLWARNGFVIIKNKKCKIIANICMEAIIIDLCNIPAKIGDYVTILSSYPTLNANIIAQNCNTIEYEILTNFSNIPIKKIKN